MATKTEKLFEHSCRPGSADGVCRSRGGESCAFDGAMVVLGCIADAAHLVHGPIACLGNSWESRGTVTDKGMLHRRSYTTDLTELDIIYGAEKKLMSALRHVRLDSGAKAIFVYTTCVSGLIGEDVDAVCKKASRELGIKVIPVPAPGFVGPKNLGNRIAGDVLVEHVIGASEPPFTTDSDINLIGEYNIAGDLELVEPVLKRAGFNVLARITGNAGFDEVAAAHRARLNVVVCGRALINVAREMESRYGIPYVEVSFFGGTETSKALRTIADGLAGAGVDLHARVERVVADEEARLSRALEPYDGLAGKRAVLYTGGVKSWSFIAALKDLGVEVAAVGTKKSTYEDEQKMKALMGADAPLFENTTPGNILKLLREKKADILVAGGRNQYLAIKEGYPFVDVNQERHVPYAGYAGLVNLAREMDRAIRFYSSSQRPSAGGPAVQRDDSPLVTNPLKHSPAIGAAMALQGVDRAAVVMHGAQGCSFLGKVLLTKHFREPIAMVSTKLFVEDVVMGSAEKLARTIEGLGANKAELIGVVTSGLTEVRGEDTALALRGTGEEGPEVVLVSTPDYDGGLEEGYAAAVTGLCMLAEDREQEAGLVNILAGPSLTPSDADELKNTVEDYGLTPVLLPDLSALDGSREGFSGLASGGTSLADIKRMGGAVITLVIGPSLEDAAGTLLKRCNVPYIVFDGLTGIGPSDKLHVILSELSGRGMPERHRRARRKLVDGMRDAMTAFGGGRVAIAAETDTSLAMSHVLAAMGAEVPVAVVPTMSGAAKRIQAGRVVVGDYTRVAGELDLLVAGSHGEQAADSLGVRHFVWGFPVFDRLGHNNTLSAGYEGTLGMINALGNALMEVER